MCGRFTLRTPAQQIAEVFGLPELPNLAPRYNIAPTQSAAAVRLSAERQRQLVLLRWGLIPFWADDQTIGNRLINARGESVASKPAFRQAFLHRRCLIVADGFYEWRKAGSQKQPYYIRLTSDRPFALAGLWERWTKGPEPIESCTIITTEANELMRPLHNRMPVLLAPEHHQRWLDPDAPADRALEALLRPYPAAEMEAFPVSPLVNNPRNDVADCLQPMPT